MPKKPIETLNNSPDCLRRYELVSRISTINLLHLQGFDNLSSREATFSHRLICTNRHASAKTNLGCSMVNVKNEEIRPESPQQIKQLVVCWVV